MYITDLEDSRDVKAGTALYSGKEEPERQIAAAEIPDGGS